MLDCLHDASYSKTHTLGTSFSSSTGIVDMPIDSRQGWIRVTLVANSVPSPCIFSGCSVLACASPQVTSTGHHGKQACAVSERKYNHHTCTACTNCDAWEFIIGESYSPLYLRSVMGDRWCSTNCNSSSSSSSTTQRHVTAFKPWLGFVHYYTCIHVYELSLHNIIACAVMPLA
jgi:hypothetical protein